MAGIFKRRKDDQPQFFATVGEGLKKIYKAKLLPLEEAYDFHDFVSPQLNDPDFDAKPMILFVGQYSTGKGLLLIYVKHWPVLSSYLRFYVNAKVASELTAMPMTLLGKLLFAGMPINVCNVVFVVLQKLP